MANLNKISKMVSIIIQNNSPQIPKKYNKIPWSKKIINNNHNNKDRDPEISKPEIS